MRVKAIISYRGDIFFGSQIQNNGLPTVNNLLNKELLNLNINTNIISSGRTDKNVHATGQVIHFDLPSFWSDVQKLKHLLNNNLYPKIKILSIYKMSNDFHARFSAKQRVYRYIISDKENNIFQDPFVTYISSIDKKLLSKLIRHFIGIHNFNFFQKKGSEPLNYTRIIYNAFSYQYKDYTILHFRANSFLRSQIRLMVGALLDTLEQKISKEDLIQQIANKKRSTTRLAPANGLYLAKIIY